METLPGWAQDGLYVETGFRLGWRERLRVLFGCEVLVSAITATDAEPGGSHA